MATVKSQQIYDYGAFDMPVGKLRDEAHRLPKDPWSLVLGDPRYDNSSAYDERDRTTWILPDAFAGVRKKLSDTIERWIFFDENWYLTVMPFEIVTDSNSVVWNEVIFKGQLATPTPHLGPVRLVKSERKENTASFVRWGIGYYMEHGFMNTPLGIQYHFEHLQQMATAALETAKFDVIYTLLQSQDMQKAHEIKYNTYLNKRIEDVLSEQVWMFASLQKYKRAMNQLETHVQEKMNMYGGRADTWIVPPQLINYLSIVPDEYLEYRKIGALGPRIVEDGPRPFGMIAKSKVYVARTYHTEDLLGRQDILSAPQEIGEYYKMHPRHKRDHEKYTSRSRHIQIYDEDDNSWHEVSLTEALDNSYLFNADGTPSSAKSEYESGFQADGGGDDDLDIWNYRDENGDTHQAKYFGEMPLPFFNTGDKLQWAFTAMQALKRDLGDVSYTEFVHSFNEGMKILRYLDEYAELAPVEVAKLAIKTSTENPRSEVFVIKENKQTSTSAIELTDVATKLESLIPGLQSWAGLKFIATNPFSSAAQKALPFDRFVRKVSDFNSSISRLVDALRRYCPKCIFTDAEFASAWWWYPEPETVLVENLLVPFRPPAFTSGADIAMTIGQTGGDLSDYVLNQIFVPLVQGQTNALINSNPSSDTKLGYYQAMLVMAAAKLISADVDISLFFTRLGMNNTRQFPTKLFGDGTMQSEKEFVVKKLSDYAMENPGAVELRKKEEIEKVFDQLTETFNVQYALYEKSRGGIDVRTTLPEDMVRTPLLVGPNLAVKISNMLTKNDPVNIIPANPHFPEIPMSLEQLHDSVRHLPGVTRRAAETTPSDFTTVFNSRVGDASNFGLEHTSIHAKAISSYIGHHLIDDTHFASAFLEGNNPQISGHFSSGRASYREASMSRGSGLYMSRLHGEAEGKVRHVVDIIGKHIDPSTRRQLNPTVERVMAHHNHLMGITFKTSFAEINNEASGALDRTLAHVYAGSEIHRHVLNRWIEHNLVFPISFYVCRPHMQYSMLFAIKCLAGKEMGRTIMKPGLFEISDNADIQAHLGTYTYYSKAVVTKDEHVYIARAVYSNGYLGGTGSRAIDPETYQAGGGNYSGQSIIFLAVPYNDEIKGVLSLTGTLTLAEYDEYQINQDHELQYVTAPRYNSKYGWRRARLVDEFDAAPLDDVYHRKSNNVLCFQGHQFYFDSTSKEFRIVEVGKGHWDEFTYIGVNNVRSGRLVRFERPNWEGCIRA